MCKQLVTILIIDDDHYVRHSLMTEFSRRVKHSYSVGAETVHFALAAIEENKPDWIVLDLGLLDPENEAEESRARLIVFDKIRQATPKARSSF